MLSILGLGDGGTTASRCCGLWTSAEPLCTWSSIERAASNLYHLVIVVLNCAGLWEEPGGMDHWSRVHSHRSRCWHYSHWGNKQVHRLGNLNLARNLTMVEGVNTVCYTQKSTFVLVLRHLLRRTLYCKWMKYLTVVCYKFCHSTFAFVYISSPYHAWILETL